jgi:hypothetical protein
MAKSGLLCALMMLFAALSLGLANDEKEEKEEKAIELSDCPKAVQKTLKREANGSELEEITKEEEDGKTVYEAEVEIDGKDYEIEVTEDGTLLSKELEDDDDEEEGDDDDDTNDNDDDD